jgi:hypothetical protein
MVISARTVRTVGEVMVLLLSLGHFIVSNALTEQTGWDEWSDSRHVRGDYNTLRRLRDLSHPEIRTIDEFSLSASLFPANSVWPAARSMGIGCMSNAQRPVLL